MAATIRESNQGAGYREWRVWLKGVFEKSLESAAPEVDADTTHGWMWIMDLMMLHPLAMASCGHGRLMGGSW